MGCQLTSFEKARGEVHRVPSKGELQVARSAAQDQQACQLTSVEEEHAQVHPAPNLGRPKVEHGATEAAPQGRVLGTRCCLCVVSQQLLKQSLRDWLGGGRVPLQLQGLRQVHPLGV